MSEFAGWVRRATVLVVVVMSVAVSRAGSDLASQIAEGDLDGAARTVADASAVESLKSDTPGLRTAAEALVAKAATPGKAAPVAAVAAFLVAAGDAAAAAKADDENAWWAVAEARAAEAIGVVAGGKKASADTWFAAADAYDKAAEAAPPGDDARLRCVKRLLEGACAVASQGNVVVTRALAAAQRGVKDPATVPSTRMVYSRALLDGAGVLVAADRRGAREAVKVAYDAIRPALGGGKPDRDVATLWNDLVTFERSNKLPIGEKYVTDRVMFFEGNYSIDVPIGPRWKAAGGASGGAEDDWGERREPNRIVRQGSAGNRVGWFWGQIFGFSWVYRYADAKNPVGGDNPGAIADVSIVRFASVYFRKVTSKKNPRRGKLNNHVTGFAYELTGIGNDEKPLRIRGWVFRGRGQQSYGLVYFDESPSDLPDPEMDAVMESVRERED